MELTAAVAGATAGASHKLRHRTATGDPARPTLTFGDLGAGSAQGEGGRGYKETLRADQR
eukprot:6206505-Pleurochrysis_carterae.AAC.1